MKRTSLRTSIFLSCLGLFLVFSASATDYCMIGDEDGFGMGDASDSDSLLYSYLHPPIGSGIPVITSANMNDPVAGTYFPFIRNTASGHLRAGDFLPDVCYATDANFVDLIPLPMTTEPSQIRQIWWYYDGSRDLPDYYYRYSRGENPLVETGDIPLTDSWDNRSVEEIQTIYEGESEGEEPEDINYARYTDLTLSISFGATWPHLGYYPLAENYDPVTIEMTVATPVVIPELFFYFPIGDYDVGPGASITFEAKNNARIYNLSKQDNRYQQGLIQPVVVELFNENPPGGNCDTPLFSNFFDMFDWVGIDEQYEATFVITINLPEEPYYAIDYFLMTDEAGLRERGIRLVGPNRYRQSIQDAIDDAESGDTIFVDYGTYYENIQYDGKNLVLSKWDTCDRPLIDGGGNNSVITLDGTESYGTIIRGFDITNGDNIYGGGIYARGSYVQIEDCHIYGNTAEYGGGIFAPWGYVLNCILESNSAGVGGGVYIYGSSPKFFNCVFGGTDSTKGNTGSVMGGAVCYAGLLEYPGAPSFNRCSFYYNGATALGGGALFAAAGGAESGWRDCYLTNCDFWRNGAYGEYAFGGGIFISSYTNVYAVNCTFNINMVARANGGGAIRVGTLGASDYAHLDIKNSVIWQDIANGVYNEVVVGPAGTASIAYSSLKDMATPPPANVTYDHVSILSPHFMNSDPQNDPWDLRPENIVGNWIGYNGCTSPQPAEDRNGVHRPLGTKADWGAYENVSVY